MVQDGACVHYRASRTDNQLAECSEKGAIITVSILNIVGNKWAIDLDMEIAFVTQKVSLPWYLP